MILGDFINSLATDAGVKPEDENLKAFLSTEAAKIELKDEFAKAVKSGLFTIAAAKENPELKKHFSAQVLDTMDKEIAAAAETLKLDETGQQKLSSEKSTYKKVALLANMVKDLKAPESNDVTKKKLEETISALNTELAGIKDNTIPKEKHDQLITEKDKQIDGLYQDKLYAGFRWANNNIPAVANITTANALVASEMAERGLSWKRENGSLKLVTAEDTEYYLENKKVTPVDFVQQVAARYNLLENSSPADPAKPKPNAPDVKPEAKEAYQIALQNAENVSKALGVPHA